MTNIASHLLTSIVLAPIMGMFLILLMPARFLREIKIVGMISALGSLILCAFAFATLRGAGDFEFEEILPWVSFLNIHWYLGIDGVSISLLMLVSILAPISLIVSWKEMARDAKAASLTILFAEAMLLIIFSTLDLFVFCAALGGLMVDVTFMIGAWGGGGKDRSAIKFLIFMMLGYMALVVAVLYAAYAAGSFDLLTMYAHKFAPMEQVWLFALFGFAFGIWLPLAGFHSWLIDAQSEAPTAASILMAGVVLKIGAYGFYRIAIPVFPLGVSAFITPMLVLAVVGIVAGPLLSYAQADLKRFVASTSIFQMGLVFFGLVVLDGQAASGAVLLMFAHGITVAALFLLVQFVKDRGLGTSIGAVTGLAKKVPVLSTFFIVAVLAAIGVPGLNYFFGDILVLLGGFQTRTLYSAIALPGLVLIAAVFLRVVCRVFFGAFLLREESHLADIGARELVLVLPLIIIMFVTGLLPQVILSKTAGSTEAFIKLSKRVEMLIPAIEKKHKVSPETRDLSPETQPE